MRLPVEERVYWADASLDYYYVAETEQEAIPEIWDDTCVLS